MDHAVVLEGNGITASVPHPDRGCLVPAFFPDLLACAPLDLPCLSHECPGEHDVLGTVGRPHHHHQQGQIAGEEVAVALLHLELTLAALDTAQEQRAQIQRIPAHQILGHPGGRGE